MTTTACDWLELPAGLTAESIDNDDTLLLRGTKQGRFLDATWRPIGVPGMRRWLTLAHEHLFVQGPRWGSDLKHVPDRTVMLLASIGQACVAIVPVLDGDAYCELSGGEKGLAVSASSGPRGEARSCLAVAVAARAADPYAAIEQAVHAAIAFMGRGKRRVDKPTPPWFDELGWCTYDAFYGKVDEQRILDGLATFNASGFSPRYVIVDGGWQHVHREPGWLESYRSKADAFTDDRLKTTSERAKAEYGVKYMAAWHTLFGSMRGANTQAPALSHLSGRYVHELETDDDVFGVVDLDSVEAFHEGYHAALAADGIDFVKVDFQSALHRMTYDQVGRAEAARQWQNSLQQAASRHLTGSVLNCMCMGTEMVYHTHTSNVSRCSDDFYPERPNAHPRHVRQNLYNALWLSQMVWPDWDMFWSAEQGWAWYHAIARALSGGPVYVSDRPDKFDPALLSKFIAADGKLLQCDQPARPTPEMIFRDPFAASAFIRGFSTAGECGVIGLFHPHNAETGTTLSEHVSPSHIPGLQGERFAVHSATQGWLGVVDREGAVKITLDVAGADLLTFAPVVDGCAIIGLIDKFVPAAAVHQVERSTDGVGVSLRGGGAFAVYCERGVGQITLDDQPVATPAEGDGPIRIDTGDRPTATLAINWSG